MSCGKHKLSCDTIYTSLRDDSVMSCVFSSKEEDEDSYSLSISPRKSIHDHLSSRKATPAHPKIPKEPIRYAGN